MKKIKERKPLEIPLKLIYIIKMIVEIFIYYVVGMGIAVYPIPMLLITLGAYTGASMDMKNLDMLIFVALPALFIVLVCAAFYLIFVRFTHKVLGKLYDKIAMKYRNMSDSEKDEKKDDVAKISHEERKRERKKK